MNQQELTDMYDQLMLINDTAFVTKQFEVAYHALCAAIHCAKQLGGESRLIEAEMRATKQAEWVRLNGPGDPSVRQYNATLAMVSLFESAIKTAASLRRQSSTRRLSLED